MGAEPKKSRSFVLGSRQPGGVRGPGEGLWPVGPWTPCVHAAGRGPKLGAGVSAGGRSVSTHGVPASERPACSGRRVAGLSGAGRAAPASSLGEALGDQSRHVERRPQGARPRFNEPAAKAKCRLIDSAAEPGKPRRASGAH